MLNGFTTDYTTIKMAKEYRGTKITATIAGHGDCWHLDLTAEYRDEEIHQGIWGVTRSRALQEADSLVSKVTWTIDRIRDLDLYGEVTE